jgi:hypothetical protein
MSNGRAPVFDDTELFCASETDNRKVDSLVFSGLSQTQPSRSEISQRLAILVIGLCRVDSDSKIIGVRASQNTSSTPPAVSRARFAD